jgi:hypothetical protein
VTASLAPGMRALALEERRGDDVLVGNCSISPGMIPLFTCYEDQPPQLVRL